MGRNKTFEKDKIYSYELNKWCVMFANKISALKFALKIGGRIYKGFDRYLVTKEN